MIQHLDVPIPVVQQGDQLLCEIGHNNGRVIARVYVVRGQDRGQPHRVRMNVVLWRGIVLPALQSFAKYNNVPFHLVKVTSKGD